MSKLILIVDDEADIRGAIGGALRDEGYRVAEARGGQQALDRVAEGPPPDAILLDIWMKGIDGVETLSRLRERRPEIPVIMITGHGNVETAVRCLKLGAFDFLEKPLSLDKVLLTIQKALEHAELLVENEALRGALAEQTSTELIGESEPIRLLREQIARAAPSDTAILIGGESGAGKEVIARMIHRLSKRADRPFIELNCAAIPETLIEAELFGSEKGAFTGAVQKPGKFQLADGGTLFLDEIGDMSLATQAKVLRVLQDKTFQRVGGAETHKVDVRVLAATNKDLLREIEAGRFREDLYYRLNVIPVEAPALRERKGDVPLLAAHFLESFCRESGRPKMRISPEAMKILEAHAWPGNVRELKNVIERLVIMTPGAEIRPQDLPPPAGKRAEGAAEGEGEGLWAAPGIKEARAEFEKRYILRKLAENDWNVSKTAESIGLERSNLHRKIKQFGIEAPAEKR